MEITAANLVDAAEVASNLTGNTSSLLHGTGGRRENITRIDRKFYEAAVKGNFNDFTSVQNIENLLTPNKNTVLHIHLTSASQLPSETTRSVSTPKPGLTMEKCYGLTMKILRTTRSVSQQFVEQILDKCEGLVLLPNAKGETPLHMAARYGHSSIARLLIERAKRFPQDIESGIGADKKLIRATNCEKDTALHEAVRYDHIQVVEILLEMDPHHAYSANNANETPLYLASERQYKVMVNKMLEVLKSPAYDGPIGRTALHAAVINHDIEMAKNLLENEHLRVSVKHVDKKGWVPLHYAAKIGDLELTVLLLEKDGNTAYMQDKEGRTALHIAAYCGHWVVMSVIIERYPDCPELVDNKGCNALHYAAKGSSLNAMNLFFLNQSLSNLYNEKDVDGKPPLHHHATSSILNPGFFHHRVDKLAMNKQDQTALDVVDAHYIAKPDIELSKEDKIQFLEIFGLRRSPRRHLNLEDEQEENRKFVFDKETKETHVLVATLIATVSFAAGFTIPGGTIQDGDHQGRPILGQTASFKAFIVSNTIALVLSASATFMHLVSPLSKAEWKVNYLSDVAFSFILVAVAAMIVAFSTGTYAMLGSSSVGIAVLCTGLSFFILFRQALLMSFTGNFFITVIKNGVDVILFSFCRISSSFIVAFFLQLIRKELPREVRAVFTFKNLCLKVRAPARARTRSRESFLIRVWNKIK